MLTLQVDSTVRPTVLQIYDSYPTNKIELTESTHNFRLQQVITTTVVDHFDMIQSYRNYT
jgi:hypothetical protein